MTSTTVSLIAFAFIFGGALLGMLLSSVLPRPHLTSDSNDSVKLGMGLVATMCALVLGLLIASAKTFYDTQNAELTEISAKTVLLDRAFAHYGPEANECRALLRTLVERLIDRVQPGNSQGSQLDSTSPSAETLFEKTQALSPKDDRQRLIQSQALNLEIGMGQTRWLMFAQAAVQVPKPLVAVLIFWLTIIFIGWGIFAPHNTTVVATWFICALSVSCAIFLIIVLALRGSDSRFQRAASRRSGASRSVTSARLGAEIVRRGPQLGAVQGTVQRDQQRGALKTCKHVAARFAEATTSPR
jgi:hypothetical protein